MTFSYILIAYANSIPAANAEARGDMAPFDTHSERLLPTIVVIHFTHPSHLKPNYPPTSPARRTPLSLPSPPPQRTFRLSVLSTVRPFR